MVDERSHLSRRHEMHTVQIRHIDSSLVREGIVLIVLRNIECKKDHIHAINVLKHHNAFATVGEFLWVVLMGVSGFHEVTYFMFPVRGCHLTNGKGAACREGFVCIVN